MADRMNTSMDTPTFDLQATYLSFEERRWLWRQRQEFQLDKIVQEVTKFHSTIRNHDKFPLLPSTLTSKTMVTKKSLADGLQLFNKHSPFQGFIGGDIDHFRLYHQQLFHLIFADVFTDSNYAAWLVLLEGALFYASQTVKDYTTTVTGEMRKCLESFPLYIQRRTARLTELMMLLSASQLPSYAVVHTAQQQHVGVLCHLSPKVSYALPASAPFNSILAMDDYAAHTISPEELRCLDYSTNMKYPRHATYSFHAWKALVPPTVQPPAPAPRRINNPTDFSQSLHSLPIDYPYTEDQLYSTRFPSIWTSGIHSDADRSVAFRIVSLDRASPEFTFVERSFHKTISELEVNLLAIERVENPSLWEQFSVFRSHIRQKNKPENTNEGWYFHGTKSNNHHQILERGFNRSHCKETVLYGLGVYFSRFAGYSRLYSDQKDLSFLFLCRVLAGYQTPGSSNIRDPPMIKLLNGQSVRADSTTDKATPPTMVCTFHDAQNYPEYIITYADKTRAV